MSIQNLYSTIRPSLNLDFANTKTLDPRITFTRASTATYYDGKTVAKAEENLLLRSQEFEQATWVKQAVTVAANSTVSPDGTTTADTITVDTTTGYHNVYHSIYPVSIGRVYTLSVYCKAKEYTLAYLSDMFAGRIACSFDLSAGTAGTPTGNASSKSASITNAGNGWYRCSITWTPDVNTNCACAFIGYPSGANLDSYGAKFTGDDTSGIYLWGAQLEQRSSVTAYTPTTTLPITNYIPVLQTAAANVARFNHDPITGESLGLLIEEQRTNLLHRSQEFDVNWTLTDATVTANQIVAPDGTLTADLLRSTSTGQSRAERVIAIPGADTTYAFSVFAKAGSSPFIALSKYSGNQAAIFNLLTGQVVSQTSGANASIVSVGNGWYRVSMIDTVRTTDSSANWKIHPSTESFFGTSAIGNSIYIWGAQLEAGAFPTSYIPTVAAQATRNADAASMTGVNFSSWYRADAISVVAEALSPKGADPGGNSAHLFVISDSTLNERLRISRISAKTQTLAEVRYGGVVQASIDTGALADNVPIKVAAAFMLNDFAFCRNGGAVGVDTSGSMPLSPTRLEIGVANGVNLTQWNSTIKKIAFYPLRLTNAQLQALTA